MAQDVWDDNTDGVTVVFRYLFPCLFFTTSLVVTRFAPASITQHLADSVGFNSIQVVPGSVNPLAHT